MYGNDCYNKDSLYTVFCQSLGEFLHLKFVGYTRLEGGEIIFSKNGKRLFFSGTYVVQEE